MLSGKTDFTPFAVKEFSLPLILSFTDFTNSINCFNAPVLLAVNLSNPLLYFSNKAIASSSAIFST